MQVCEFEIRKKNVLTEGRSGRSIDIFYLNKNSNITPLKTLKNTISLISKSTHNEK